MDREVRNFFKEQAIQYLIKVHNAYIVQLVPDLLFFPGPILSSAGN
jgi:hypothetical protein